MPGEAPGPLEKGGAIRGRTEVLGRFRAELEGRHRWERVSLGKAHSEAVRGSERKVGEAYRSGMEGSEERAREAARTDGGSVYYIPPIERDVRLTVRAERMELVRELDGEQAYEKAHEKMRRAVERASQPPPSHVPSRSGPERSGPGAGLWPQPLVFPRWFLFVRRGRMGRLIGGKYER